MRRIKARLAIACMCAVATALFTGAALAGNGNDNAPGQVKKDEAAAAQASAQAQVQVGQSVATSTQTQSTQAQLAQSDHVAPGQTKKAAASTSATKASSNATSNVQAQQTANANPAVAGMKPTNNTGHWTTCGLTSGTPSAATCPAQQNATAEARVHTDSSKRYGNAHTAAQIAVSRGGTGVMLTGPGNSQPHKVAVCPHKKNPSGGVDVHAIKNYNPASCQPTQSQQVVTSSVCGSTTVTTITTTSQAAVHGKGKHLGKANAKHQVTSTSSSTQVLANGQVCATSSPVVVQSTVTPAANVAPVTQANTAPATVAPSNATGSVAGTQAALVKPKAQHAKPTHGVLGTVTRVSGSTLPFTGFPLWIALAVALGLIGAGVALRRRGSALRV